MSSAGKVILATGRCATHKHRCEATEGIWGTIIVQFSWSVLSISNVEEFDHLKHWSLMCEGCTRWLLNNSISVCKNLLEHNLILSFNFYFFEICFIIYIFNSLKKFHTVFNSGCLIFKCYLLLHLKWYS